MTTLRTLRGLLAAAALSLGALHAAAPVARDLGDGLLYFRVQTAPVDLPSDAAVRGKPCVLDLRYTEADPAAPAALEFWLRQHATNRTPIFVLVNGATARGLLEILDDTRIPGVLTVGVKSPAFEPDIVVTESPDAERRAYDALQQDTDVTTLTTDYPDKRRNDEASLAHEPPEPPDAAAAGGDNAAERKPRQPLTDAALQRAIHLHRGLKAMRRVE